MKYDPNQAPNPGQWRRLTEQQQLDLVLAAHANEPNLEHRDEAHAVLHSSLEMELPSNPVLAKILSVLMAKGHSRHEAIDRMSEILIDKVVRMSNGAVSSPPAAGGSRRGRKAKATDPDATTPATGDVPARTRKPAPVPGDTVYQLRVELMGTDPLVWRRFLVPAHYSLGQLHAVLQAVMGWENAHLHNFEKDGVVWENGSDPIYARDTNDEQDTKLGEVLLRVKSRLNYVYDFGDEWQHKIVLEKKISGAGAAAGPVCLEGERACPPEDCGGVCGYLDMVFIMGDPKHEDHEQILEWLGEDFAPEDFDPATANHRLKKKKKQ